MATMMAAVVVVMLMMPDWDYFAPSAEPQIGRLRQFRRARTRHSPTSSQSRRGSVGGDGDDDDVDDDDGKGKGVEGRGGTPGGTHHKQEAAQGAEMENAARQEGESTEKMLTRATPARQTINSTTKLRRPEPEKREA